MSRFKWLTLAFAMVVPVLGHAQTVAALVVPPAESVGGQTQKDWSATWWQWAASFDRNESPVADTTGELCVAKQKGSVWFLAGTYGTKRTIRTCTIPEGKYLFFPLINSVSFPNSQRPPNCMVSMSSAAMLTNDVSSLVLEIDGVRIENLELHRQATKCFDLGAESESKAKIFPAAGNGYYVMIRPLSRGTHTLNFGGALPSMLQAVTYTLEVQ